MERYTIQIRDKNYEKGYNSNSNLRLFFDVMQDELSNKESLVDSITLYFNQNSNKNNSDNQSVYSNIFTNANSKLLLLEVLHINSDYLASTTSLIKDMTVNQLKDAYRVNTLVLGGKKKDLQDRF